jgi:hypothetical protein
VLSINIHRKFGLLEIMSFSFYEVEKSRAGEEDSEPEAKKGARGFQNSGVAEDCGGPEDKV